MRLTEKCAADIAQEVDVVERPEPFGIVDHLRARRAAAVGRGSRSNTREEARACCLDLLVGEQLARRASLPEGSPTRVVPPPISVIGRWPAFCSQRSIMIDTRRPTWSDGAVQSIADIGGDPAVLRRRRRAPPARRPGGYSRARLSTCSSSDLYPLPGRGAPVARSGSGALYRARPDVISPSSLTGSRPSDRASVRTTAAVPEWAKSEASSSFSACRASGVMRKKSRHRPCGSSRGLVSLGRSFRRARRVSPVPRP